MRPSILVSSLLVAVSACTSSTESPPRSTKSPSATLKAISLPDLSKAAPPVQAQVREQYTLLNGRIAANATPTSELATSFGAMGQLLLAAEYLDAAEPCFLNAQALAPADMRWPYYLGHLYRFRSDPGRAATFFEQTRRLQPDHVPTLVWLGEMYLAVNRPDAAEPPLAKAFSLQTNQGAVRYGLGRVALAKRDYGQAVAHLEKALAIKPDATRVHYPLAMAYRGRGDRKNADAHLGQRGEGDLTPEDPLMEVLAQLLTNAAAYEVRAAEAMNTRQWNDAVTHLRKAIELAPDNPLTRLNLGTALYLAGEAGPALEQYQTAVRLRPDLAKAHYSIGVLMDAVRRDREAIDAFASAVTHDARYVEARLSLADALRRTGQLEQSLPHYAHIINEAPAVSQAHFGYAMALVRLRRYGPARDWLTQGMKTYPDQPGFAHALARVLAAAPDDQVRDGRRAMQLLQDLLTHQKTLGLVETMAMALAEIGAFDQAAAWQRDLITAAKRQNAYAPRMGENLTLYLQRHACRIPWRDDDPVFAPRPASDVDLAGGPVTR